MPFNKMLPILLLILIFGFSCAPAPLDPAATASLAQLAAGNDLIVAKKIKGEIPLDPSAKVWSEAKEVSIPLVSQTSVIPRMPYKKTGLKVRALCNNKEVGFLLTWSDRTKNDSVMGSRLFGDAMALAFPMNYGEGLSLPYIGMGNKDNPVNIWQWKAAWQKDIDKGFETVAEANPGMVPDNAPLDFHTGAEAGSPLSREKKTSTVENLVAAGFGTLTSTPSKGLMGKGVWQNGTWQVVITRPRKPAGTASQMGADKGGLIPISFAVWDGAKEQRNGMKEITRWRFLQFEGEGISLPWLTALITNPLKDGNVAKGKQLVTKLGCVQCHNMPGAAAVKDVGPDLVHAGAILRPDYLLESIEHPNAVIVPSPGYYDSDTWTSTMPSYEGAITKQDYIDMAKYLETLQ